MRLAIILLLIAPNLYAQAIYDANGQYRGYSQTSPSGVTNTYNATGQNVGSSQIDNGQTNYYSPQGQYQGAIQPPPYQCNLTPLLTHHAKHLKHRQLRAGKSIPQKAHG